MEVKISDLPGIGKKYALIPPTAAISSSSSTSRGARVLSLQDPDDDEADYSFQLTDEEARKIGAIMLGVDYQPVADDRMELFLRNVRMEWIKVKPDCALADKRIDEARVRTLTGCTIIGIQREGRYHRQPGHQRSDSTGRHPHGHRQTGPGQSTGKPLPGIRSRLPWKTFLSCCWPA
jgi:TrkA domain protein